MNNVLLNSSIPISLVGSREVVEGSPSKRQRLLLALDEIFGSRQIARQIIDELGLDRYEPVVVLHLQHRLSTEAKVQNIHFKGGYAPATFLIAVEQGGWITIMMNFTGNAVCDIVTTLDQAVQSLLQAYLSPYDGQVDLPTLEPALRECIAQAFSALPVED